MPEDQSDERWPEEVTATEDPSAAHDGIMKRLLNYQRSLREGASPAEAAEAAEVAEIEETAEIEEVEETAEAEQVVEVKPTPEGPTEEQRDLSAAEPGSEATADVVPEPVLEASEAGSKAELEERVQRLEERLERLGSKVGALRQSFQDMAIAADERLAAMEDEIGQVRSEQDDA